MQYRIDQCSGHDVIAEDFRPVAQRPCLTSALRGLLVATAGERIPDEISEISSHRIPLIHSESDSERSRNVGAVLSAADAERFYQAVVNLALWLWNDRRPMPVSLEFERSNLILVAK